MPITNYRKVKNFIEYTGKPFTIDVLTGETGLTHMQTRKIVAKLMKIGMIRVLTNEGKKKIYIKNAKFKDNPKTNPQGYNLKMLEKIYKTIKTKPISSTRNLRVATGFERTAIMRYLTALASMEYITLKNGQYYTLVNKPDFLLVGMKIEEGILTRLRDNDTGGKMARKEKILIDEKGREYPAKILDPQIVKRDALVNKVMNRATKLHDKLISEKERMATDIDKYLDQIAQQYGEKWKGNAELISFDGRSKVEIRQRELIKFSEKLQIAKQKIDDCLKRWSEDSNINLQAVIKEAFQVDKKGEIAKNRILDLRKYNISDPQWKLAMELIDQAIQVTSTKQYIAFYQRPAIDKPFQLVSLNFSAI